MNKSKLVVEVCEEEGMGLFSSKCFSKFQRSSFQKLPLIFLFLCFQALMQLQAEQAQCVCRHLGYFWGGKQEALIRLIGNPEGVDLISSVCVVEVSHGRNVAKLL